MQKTRVLNPDSGSEPIKQGGPSSQMNHQQAIDRGWTVSSGLQTRRIASYATCYASSYAATGMGNQYFYSTERKPPRYNNCTNRKILHKNYAITVTYHKGDTSKYGRCWNLGYYRRSPSTYSTSHLASHYGELLRATQSRAWAVMQPRFQGDVNMLVFLAEMSDFKDIAKFLFRKPVRKIANFFRKSREKLKKAGTWDISKPAAGLYLTNEFAIKPLVKDIGIIATQLELCASEAQRQFSDAGRDRSTRHYEEVLYDVTSDSRSAYDISVNPQLLVGYHRSCTFNATMEYQYAYKMRGSVDTFMKYWGLYPSAEAFWELVPFSFVVDYFVNIGDSIKAASKDKNVHLKWSQYCESLLSIETRGYHYRSNYIYGPMLVGGAAGTTPDVSGHNLYSGSQASLYTRRVGQPYKGIVLPRISAPSSKQKLNLLALARAIL